MYNANPKNYAEVSKPHESIEAANKAAQNFLVEVEELRRKYQIPEVAITVSLNAIDDGIQVPLIMTSSYGDIMVAEALFAHGLGSARQSRQAIIGKIMAG